MIDEREQSSRTQRNLELVVQTGLLLAKHLDMPTLVQAATDAGFLCVYIDVWQYRSDVLGAINYGLQEAIDDLEVPKSVVAKRLKTNVKKVSAGSIALEFGDEPARRRPDSPFPGRHTPFGSGACRL